MNPRYSFGESQLSQPENSDQQFQQQEVYQQLEIDNLLKDALKKEISLRFMLGIYKLHTIQISSQQNHHNLKIGLQNIKFYNQDINEPAVYQKNPHQSDIIKSKNERLFQLNPNLEQIQNENIKLKETLENKEQNLINRMKSLRFADVKVKDNQCQTEQMSQENLEKQEIQIQKLLDPSQNIAFEEKINELQQREQVLHRKEQEMQILEEQYNEKLTQLQNKELQIDLKLKELSFEPLKSLNNSESLKAKLKSIKQDLYENFQQYVQNIPNKQKDLQIDQENQEFYELFKQWSYDQQFLGKKISLLMNLEIHLMEERYKMEIVEDYLKKEYDQIQVDRKDVDNQKLKYSMVENYEKAIQEENKILEQKKVNFEKYKEQVEQNITIIKEYISYKYNIIYNNLGLDSNQTPLQSYLQQISQELNQINENQVQENDKKQKLLNLKFKINQQTQQNFISFQNDKNFQNNMKQLQNEKQDILLQKQNELEMLKKQVNNEYDNLQEQQVVLKQSKANLLNISENKYENLVTENESLKQELAKLKQKLQHSRVSPLKVSSFEQSLTSPKNQENEQQQIDLLISEAKQKQLLIKMVNRWLMYVAKYNNNTLDTIKLYYLYLWKLKLYDASLFRKISNLKDDPYTQNILETKWQHQKDNLIASKRYPLKSLSQKRRDLEIQYLDLERKKFYKNRIVILLNSIFRKQRRLDRLFVVIAFHKIGFYSLLNKVRQTSIDFKDYLKFKQQQALQQKMESELTNYPNNNQEIKSKSSDVIVVVDQRNQPQIQQPLQHKEQGTTFNQNLKPQSQIGQEKQTQTQKQLPQQTISRRDLSPISVNKRNIAQSSVSNSTVSLKKDAYKLNSQRTKEQNNKKQEEIAVKKQICASRVCFFLLNQHISEETSLVHNLQKSLFKWRLYTIIQEKNGLIQQLDNFKNLLSNYVVKEDMFRAKLRIQKSETEQKTNLIQDMLQVINFQPPKNQ